MAFFEDLISLIERQTIQTDLAKTTIVISTGIKGYLGINEALHKRLKAEKEAGKIEDYLIDTSLSTLKYYNRLNKQGKLACLLIHTAG